MLFGVLNGFARPLKGLSRSSKGFIKAFRKHFKDGLSVFKTPFRSVLSQNDVPKQALTQVRIDFCGGIVRGAGK